MSVLGTNNKFFASDPNGFQNSLVGSILSTSDNTPSNSLKTPVEKTESLALLHIPEAGLSTHACSSSTSGQGKVQKRDESSTTDKNAVWTTQAVLSPTEEQIRENVLSKTENLQEKEHDQSPSLALLSPRDEFNMSSSLSVNLTHVNETKNDMEREVKLDPDKPKVPHRQIKPTNQSKPSEALRNMRTNRHSPFCECCMGGLRVDTTASTNKELQELKQKIFDKLQAPSQSTSVVIPALPKSETSSKPISELSIAKSILKKVSLKGDKEYPLEVFIFHQVIRIIFETVKNKVSLADISMLESMLVPTIRAFDQYCTEAISLSVLLERLDVFLEIDNKRVFDDLKQLSHQKSLLKLTLGTIEILHESDNFAKYEQPIDKEALSDALKLSLSGEANREYFIRFLLIIMHEHYLKFVKPKVPVRSEDPETTFTFDSALSTTDMTSKLSEESSPEVQDETVFATSFSSSPPASDLISKEAGLESTVGELPEEARKAHAKVIINQVVFAKACLRKLNCPKEKHHYSLLNYLISEFLEVYEKMINSDVCRNYQPKFPILNSFLKMEELPMTFFLTAWKSMPIGEEDKTKMARLFELSKCDALYTRPIKRIIGYSDDTLITPLPRSEDHFMMAKISLATVLRLTLLHIEYLRCTRSDKENAVLNKNNASNRRFHQLKAAVQHELDELRKSEDERILVSIEEKEAQLKATVKRLKDRIASFKKEVRSHDPKLQERYNELVEICQDAISFHESYYSFPYPVTQQSEVMDSEFETTLFSPSQVVEEPLTLPALERQVSLPSSAGNSPRSSIASEDDNAIFEHFSRTLFPEPEMTQAELDKIERELKQEKSDATLREDLNQLFSSRDLKLEESVWRAPAKVALMIERGLLRKRNLQIQTIQSEDRDEYNLQLKTICDYINMTSRSFSLMLRMIDEVKWNLIAPLFNKWMLGVYTPLEKMFDIIHLERGLPLPTVHNLSRNSHDLNYYQRTGRERQSLIDDFSQANLWYRYSRTYVDQYRTPPPSVLQDNIFWLDLLQDSMSAPIQINKNLKDRCVALATFIVTSQERLVKMLISSFNFTDDEKATLRSYFRFNRNVLTQLTAIINNTSGEIAAAVADSMDETSRNIDNRLQAQQRKLEQYIEKLQALNTTHAKKAKLELKDGLDHILLMRGALRVQHQTSQLRYLHSVHYQNALEGHWPLEKLYRAEMFLFGINEEDFRGVHQFEEFNRKLAPYRQRVEMNRTEPPIDREKAKANIEEQQDKSLPCNFGRTYDARITFAYRGENRTPHGVNRLADIISESNKEVCIEDGTARQNSASRVPSKELINKICDAVDAQLSFLKDALENRFSDETWV